MIKNNLKIKLVLSFIAIALSFFVFTGNAYAADASSSESYPSYGLIDEGALVTDATQQDEINNELKGIYDKYKVSVYIYTTTEVGMSDDYDGVVQSLHSELKGLTNEDNMVILFIGYKENDHVYQIDSYGSFASNYISSSRAKLIKSEHMQTYMVNGDFYNAELQFTDRVSYYLSQNPQFDTIFFKWWFQLIIAFVISGIIIAVMVSGAGGKVTTTSRTYLDGSHSKVLSGFERYTHTTVTRVKHESRSGGGGGGGGGGHSSSGGSSF